MNFSWKVLFLFFLIAGCTTSIKTQLPTKPDITNYEIVTGLQADSLTKYAAKELQSYLRKIFKKPFAIQKEVQPEKPQIIIGKTSVFDKKLLNRIDALKEDGFIIKSNSDGIILAGKEGKTDLYAVYTFLEDYLGCLKLTPKAEFVPQLKHFIIPEINKTYEPAFSFRRILLPGRKDTKFRNWHKLEELDEWGSFVHTFRHLISPDEYFEKHPEYFSLINGRRLKDSQLCLSNPEVISLLKENLGRQIENKPEMKYWSVSQNDAINNCECNPCNNLYKKYGEISGAYIEMANQLAEAFPEKQISTLAYQYTRSAPVNIKPRPNVNIMFCSIECNRGVALKDDPRSKGFVKDMGDWTKLTSNIFVWDYVVQFKNYLTPFPNFHVLKPNLQFFKKHNVPMMFEQGSNMSWSDLAELKQYLLAKLIWNPEQDVNKLVTTFLTHYYGPAAKPIRDYYNLTRQAMIKNQDKEFLDIYGFPMNYKDSFLTPSLLVRYKALMDSAQFLVLDNPIYLKRVLRARLAVDFAYLDIALNGGFEQVSFFDNVNGRKVLRQEMIDYLDEFVENSHVAGALQINERNFKTDAYREYVLNKLKRLSQENLLKGKTIKSLTAYSDKYPVGGPAALNDGLLGDLDYHNNWLGYEGEDMTLKVDLGKIEPISQITMHFLKAVNSWVFLPDTVSIESSMDDKVYKPVIKVVGDNSDQNYLVKSIPFEINFKKIESRYLQIKAISMKTCPEWHRGYGKPSWVFCDEVIVQ